MGHSIYKILIKFIITDTQKIIDIDKDIDIDALRHHVAFHTYVLRKLFRSC